MTMIGKQIDLDAGGYDFYRCRGCGRLITRLEMNLHLRGFEYPEGPTSRADGQPCPCGARRFSPCNVRWWHFLLPRVWRFLRMRRRGLV